MRFKEIIQKEVPAKEVSDEPEPEFNRLDEAASGKSIDVTGMPREKFLQLLKQLRQKNALGDLMMIVETAGGLDEMTRPQTRQQVNQILTAAGYRRLGKGMFGAIYEKPGSQYVLKVFSALDAAFLDFTKLARAHQDNPHFPKFYGKLVQVTNDYYAIRMEKLTPFNPHLFGDAGYALFDYIQDGKDGAELNDYPALKSACDLVRTKLLSIYVFDHKNEAFMVRGNTIVITDPALDLTAKGEMRWSPEPPLDPEQGDDDNELLAALGL
jgi:hypothetical protein